MAIWNVRTADKKSAEEREIWYNKEHGWKIVRINGYRWASFNVETSDDNPPAGIAAENPDGIEMYGYCSNNTDNGAELVSMDDGWFMDWKWDTKMPDEAIEEVESGYDSDGYEWMENNGWSNTETEAWLYGPLNITKEEN